ncbi:hypothetical protein KY346_04870 [Candidatus Woesearchaeota archaeon]|nr:hypothetical protein [Candidatus Woesearchaeota archaeon]
MGIFPFSEREEQDIIATATRLDEPLAEYFNDAFGTTHLMESMENMITAVADYYRDSRNPEMEVKARNIGTSILRRFDEIRHCNNYAVMIAEIAAIAAKDPWNYRFRPLSKDESKKAGEEIVEYPSYQREFEKIKGFQLMLGNNARQLGERHGFRKQDIDNLEKIASRARTFQNPIAVLERFTPGTKKQYICIFYSDLSIASICLFSKASALTLAPEKFYHPLGGEYITELLEQLDN